MWDEQEKFSRAVSQVVFRAIVVVGVALGVAGIATQSPSFFLIYVEFLAILAALVVIHALIGGGLVAILAGVVGLYGFLLGAVRRLVRRRES